jgi:predicted phosphodiesterase
MKQKKSMSLTREIDSVIRSLLEEYPTAGSLTLAKRLFKDYPHLFENTEDARSKIRYRRGASGKVLRRLLANNTHVTDKEKYMKELMSLPESAATKRPPYLLPKTSRKIMVFGDAHFPYQNNNGIYTALDYAKYKGCDTIILNGDMIDLYQISRFLKDNRKPHIEYELELYYQFLIDLRKAFPTELIIWKFGNHEERYDAYLKLNAPAMYMIATDTLEDHIPVRELGIEIVKEKRRIVCGDIDIIHGHEYPGGFGGVNPARALFLKAKTNILCNHFHRSSSHKGNDIRGNQIRAYSLGAMCSQQDYMPYGDQDCSFGYLVIENGVTWVQNREV